VTDRGRRLQVIGRKGSTQLPERIGGAGAEQPDELRVQICVLVGA
jgi:hypothetical protein